MTPLGFRAVVGVLVLAACAPVGATRIVTNPVAPGVTHCGFYVDSGPRMLVDVLPFDGEQVCALDVGVLGAGMHSIVATEISVDDPYWGSQESAPSKPLVLAAATAPVVEYYDASLDHYFITSLQSEIAALDSGAFGGTWRRTGQSFGSWATARDATKDAVPVCRLFISYPGGSSHFYSGYPAECAASSVMPGSPLLLESPSVMYILLADGSGDCPFQTQPVYRVWNNRSDSNHRFITSIEERDYMIGLGWVLEGSGPDFAVMCAPT